ncbi:helix-turn-helix domain-containing protein [Microbispora sp. H10670]|uniref:helix-turn-helix domain-containing protein n=1 Tax=Microbispora sp. H10670 TaxID=2729108 RepID=UPI0016015E1F|nr:helix-turn-helix domain-containing protein [Microbispora sp. H10670]
MFLIVVSVPLLPFLARFRAPEESPAALASLVQRLHRMRADPSRWGRPHTVVIEDVWSEVTIRCPSGLPERAYGDLLLLDLSGFGPDSPTVTVSWDGRSSAWWARLDSGPCPVLRRIPLDTGPTRRPPSVTGIGPGEVEQVRALANGGTDSAIRWQRANVVLLSIMGWNISAIARKTLLSPDRVRSLLEHVERAGIAALDPGCRGERAYRPTAEQTHEAVAIALTAPTDSDVTASASGTGWDRDTLAEHLVRAGIVEDVTAEWLDEVMRSSGRPPERGPDEPADLR